VTSGNPVVVVTGASAGVGRATARTFARRGFDVALLARGPEGLKSARCEIEDVGRRALDISVDVADHERVEAAADLIEDELGPIGVWVNNAMVSVFSPVTEMTPDEYRRVTEVTYLGHVHGTMAALRRMLPRDRGCVVQVSSTLAYRAIPLQSAYCAAKHAIKGFTESLRSELLHDHSRVRVTMVNLPALNTPQFHWVRTRLPRHPQPVPPIYQPEVAAEAIAWAADHDRREINVGLSTTATRIANKFIPGLLDRYLARTGYHSQQTRQQIEPDRPDNLFEPSPGGFDARGEFGGRALSRAWWWRVASHRQLIGLTSAALAVAAVAQRRSR
jgi:NAD(P)-dependent dehydrogenase (short-subunit alcohol dehydrogenase family)